MTLASPTPNPKWPGWPSPKTRSSKRDGEKPLNRSKFSSGPRKFRKGCAAFYLVHWSIPQACSTSLSGPGVPVASRRKTAQEGCAKQLPVCWYLLRALTGFLYRQRCYCQLGLVDVARIIIGAISLNYLPSIWIYVWDSSFKECSPPYTPKFRQFPL